MKNFVSNLQKLGPTKFRGHVKSKIALMFERKKQPFSQGGTGSIFYYSNLTFHHVTGHGTIMRAHIVPFASFCQSNQAMIHSVRF